MKKAFITLAIVLASYYSYAQTYLPLTAGNGNPLSGTLFTNNVEGIRMLGNNAYISGYNGTGSTRTGYLQFNPGAQIVLGAENATSIVLTGGNVGIGTMSPANKLDIQGGNANLYNTGSTTSLGVGSALTGKTQIVLATSSDSGGYGILESVSVGGSTWGNTIINQYGGNVGIGTTDPKGYKLAVNGSAIATSMTVKLYANWPDYVFKKGYKLASLSDVKSYVDKNKHLPDMPSEQEIAKNGLDLGEMVKLQTKKIEELTLYLIEKDKQIEDVKIANQKEINELRDAIETLKKKMP